jgi:hypothetical protein
MSGPRLNLRRPPLATGVFLLSLSLSASSMFLGCTERTPHYCDNSRNIMCDKGQTCSSNHFCVIADASGDAAPTDAADAPAADAPADHPTDTTATTDSARDAGSDAGDGAGDGAEVHTGCNANTDCTADPSKPICQQDGGACVGCVKSSDCNDPQALVCDTSVNRCVPCLMDKDCTDPTKPICDAQACRACKADMECAAIGPGVCMAHLDGHCATDAETVYVLNQFGTPNCSNDPLAGAGSRTLPFCYSQNGVDSTQGKAIPPPDGGTGDDAGNDASEAGSGGVSPDKSLVVMRGPSLTPWSFNAANRTITVVGQSDAAIMVSGFIGIHVSAGTVFVRSLHVTGAAGPSPAIIADGGELHLDRCVVDGNAKGGVLIDGAAYEVTNTVIANNLGATSTIACGAWGGVCIRNLSPGGLRRFLNNTVVMNTPVGIACGDAYPILGSIVVPVTNGQATATCAVTSCCDPGDPALSTANYHLTTASTPCIDKLDPLISTAYDIDGQPRPSPAGGRSDCGADEYVMP